MTTNKDWIESLDGRTFSLRNTYSDKSLLSYRHLDITKEILLTYHYTKDETFEVTFVEYDWGIKKGLLTRLIEALFPYGQNSVRRGNAEFTREQMIALSDWKNEMMYAIKPFEFRDE